ncbi:hypothetical protein, partial [Pseudomonas aeruginosa]
MLDGGCSLLFPAGAPGDHHHHHHYKQYCGAGDGEYPDVPYGGGGSVDCTLSLGTPYSLPHPLVFLRNHMAK